MGRVIVLSLVVVYVFFIARLINSNSEGDALTIFKQQITDPNKILESWDNSLVNPCTWPRITCNGNDEVERVDLGNLPILGQLVPQLGNLKSLQYLELYSCAFYGTIPKELGNLTNLISLDLYDNAIDGEIPPELGNLDKLKFVRINDNNLVGRVPEWANVMVVNVSGNLDLCGPYTDKQCR